MIKLAKKYGVSSSYLARICTRMNVPRPERGYWAKLEYGKSTMKASLPGYSPEFEHEWIKDCIPARPTRPPAPKLPRQKVPKPKPLQAIPFETHPIIAGTKIHFLNSLKPSSLEFNKETKNFYLRPYKKLLVDLVVSKNRLDKGLEIMNHLLKTFLKPGYRTVLTPYSRGLRRRDIDVREDPGKSPDYVRYWSPCRLTVIYIGDIAIGLTLFETSERVETEHFWGVTSDYRPSGRFVLQAYSPYSGTTWFKEWTINQDKSASRQYDKIAKELHKSIPVIVHQVDDASREAERRRQELEDRRERWRIEEEKRNREKSFEQSNELLQLVIKKWAFAKNIEAFFNEIEQEVFSKSSVERVELNDRLRLAREVLGQVNALEYFLEWKSPEEICKSHRRIWSR
jgi:hypothetical protein